MEFEWDAAKSQACFDERGFDLAYAAQAFSDPARTIEIDDRRDHGEERYRLTGNGAQLGARQTKPQWRSQSVAQGAGPGTRSSPGRSALKPLACLTAIASALGDVLRTASLTAQTGAVIGVQDLIGI